MTASRMRAPASHKSAPRQSPCGQGEFPARDGHHRAADLDRLAALARRRWRGPAAARAPDLGALRDLDLLRRRRSGRGARDGPPAGPAAEPVAGSSGTPIAGANMRVFQRSPEAGEAADVELAQLREGAPGPGSAPRPPAPSRAPRARAGGRSRSTRPAAASARRRARRAARPRARTALQDGIGCSSAPLTRSADRAAGAPAPGHPGLEAHLARARGRRRPGPPSRASDDRRTAARRPGVKMRMRASPPRSRAQHEHRLREVQLARQRCISARQPAAVGEDGQLVALQRRVGEDVEQHVVAGAAHARPALTARAGARIQGRATAEPRPGTSRARPAGRRDGADSARYARGRRTASGRSRHERGRADAGAGRRGGADAQPAGSSERVDDRDGARYFGAARRVRARSRTCG